VIIVITTGSQGTTLVVPPQGEEPRQFAHQWDIDDISDVAHQAGNFLKYRRALGEHAAPLVLLRGPVPQDPALAQMLEINLGDWQSIVQTATGMPVEIQ